MIGADLLEFAEASPAGPEGNGLRRQGRRCGFPACCIEFYAAIVPLHWARVPEAEAYWEACRGHGFGYVPCPRCREKRLETGLDKV